MIGAAPAPSICIRISGLVFVSATIGRILDLRKPLASTRVPRRRKLLG